MQSQQVKVTTAGAALKYGALLLTGGLTLSVLAYVAPTASSQQARPNSRLPIVSDEPRSWRWEHPSEGAVDSGGIENDLDGNASALTIL